MGIDIVLVPAPLDWAAARVLAQVKSGGQIGSPVVPQVHGVMATHNAEQAGFRRKSDALVEVQRSTGLDPASSHDLLAFPARYDPMPSTAVQE